MAISLVCASLLTIVVGHSMLAQDQLRLGHISEELAQEQAVNRSNVLSVADLETPARISQEAGELHLVQPAEILQLPSVSLKQVLPVLKIAPVPVK
jgi:hypothetical protein